MLDIVDIKALSWRDPDGFVVEIDSKIFRAVAPEKAEQIRELLSAPWMKGLILQGYVPKTAETAAPDGYPALTADWLWLEHDRLSFPCYPHEITALQLYDSALLTLHIGLEAAKNGWTLKDASAWNVLHSQGRPVFVDLLSFDKIAPTGMWRAYGQYVRHFVLPLLLYRKIGLVPAESFLTHRDGTTPERAYESLHGVRLASLMALEHVVLPKMLAGAGGRLIASETAHKPKAVEAEIALNLQINTLRRLQRSIEKLQPDEAHSSSVWKRYEEERLHYSDADLVAKTDFVRAHVGGGVVLDLGCNAGEFSLLAAGLGASVVAADADHAALSRLYGRIRDSRPTVTPVLLNIGRPTPAVGWMNSEVDSFVERGIGHFDCILALGLLHHLLVSERSTLPMITDLLIRLRPARIVLEWVDPSDPKFKQLAGFNADLYEKVSAGQLEELLNKTYRIDAKLTLPCATRVMYSWRVNELSQL